MQEVVHVLLRERHGAAALQLVDELRHGDGVALEADRDAEQGLREVPRLEVHVGKAGPSSTALVVR